MNNFLILPLDDACIDYGCSFAEVCLPPFEDCDMTPRDSLLVSCDEKWNCNLCESDEEYYVPFQAGDKIQIQTLFADLTNADRTNALDTDWITIELYNQNGLVTDDKSVFMSRWLFGWNGVNNYQIFEIDTSLIISSCWSLKFITADGIELCSQDFRSAQDCDQETLLIRGLHEDFDCNNFYYGEPVTSSGQGVPFKYDNTIRLNAGLYARPGTINKSLFARKVVSAIIQEIYALVLNEKIPPFIDRLLLKTYLSAPKTRIITENGKVRDMSITSFSARDRIEYSNMMLYSADLFLECSEAVKRC